MPLKKGASDKTVSSNIKTLVHDYERKGAIGNSHPASKKKAVKQAVAIALDKARKSGADIPKTGAKKSAGVGSGKKRSGGTGAKKSTTARSSTSRSKGK